MGKIYERIDDTLRAFIEKQHVYFVATAPLSAEGHVNLSPKGLDSFRILDDHTVAWLDLVGSGIETVAHLKENGRIVIMFCAFEDAPKIVRLHGTGEVIEPYHSEFDSLLQHFPDHGPPRCIIRIRCERISDSCGFGVPLYEFQGHRSQLSAWVEKKGSDGLEEYQKKHNSQSIDALNGIELK